MEKENEMGLDFYHARKCFTKYKNKTANRPCFLICLCLAAHAEGIKAQYSYL